MTSIHEQIKTRRKALGWSHKHLAEEVSRIEGLVKPLAWTSVQQWEKEGGTAPKRKRLEFVAQALGLRLDELLVDTPQRRDARPGQLAEPPPPPYGDSLPNAVQTFVGAIAALTPTTWAMVRGALDSVIGAPEVRDDVVANVLMVLKAPPDKRLAAA